MNKKNIIDESFPDDSLVNIVQSISATVSPSPQIPTVQLHPPPPPNAALTTKKTSLTTSTYDQSQLIDSVDVVKDNINTTTAATSRTKFALSKKFHSYDHLPSVSSVLPSPLANVLPLSAISSDRTIFVGGSIDNPAPKKKYDHVQSKVKLYIENLKENDRRTSEKSKFKRYRSMPETLSTLLPIGDGAGRAATADGNSVADEDDNVSVVMLKEELQTRDEQLLHKDEIIDELTEDNAKLESKVNSMRLELFRLNEKQSSSGGGGGDKKLSISDSATTGGGASSCGGEYFSAIIKANSTSTTYSANSLSPALSTAATTTITDGATTATVYNNDLLLVDFPTEPDSFTGALMSSAHHFDLDVPTPVQQSDGFSNVAQAYRRRNSIGDDNDGILLSSSARAANEENTSGRNLLPPEEDSSSDDSSLMLQNNRREGKGRRLRRIIGMCIPCGGGRRQGNRYSVTPLPTDSVSGFAIFERPRN